MLRSCFPGLASLSASTAVVLTARRRAKWLVMAPSSSSGSRSCSRPHRLGAGAGAPLKGRMPSQSTAVPGSCPWTQLMRIKSRHGPATPWPLPLSRSAQLTQRLSYRTSPAVGTRPRRHTACRAADRATMRFSLTHRSAGRQAAPGSPAAGRLPPPMQPPASIMSRRQLHERNAGRGRWSQRSKRREQRRTRCALMR